MDSINQNQSEQNHQDLQGAKAIDKLKSLTEDQSCFFCTGDSDSPTGGSRPMSVRAVDDNGDLWFLSARDSHKNAAIAINPAVRLFFKGSEHAEFLSLHGHASITDDPATIDRLWSAVLKTWFTGGRDDPRITAIKVSPRAGYYWDNKHGSAVAGVKMLIGAAIGKTLDDSIEGRLTP